MFFRLYKQPDCGGWFCWGRVLGREAFLPFLPFPAFPRLILVSHPCLLQNASCGEVCPKQRPAAGQGVQMPLPQENCPSACFKGFELHHRCRNPVTVHVLSPRDRFFYESCRTVHFHRPNTGRDELSERYVSLAVPPRRAPLWYFTVNLTPFVK